MSCNKQCKKSVLLSIFPDHVSSSSSTRILPGYVVPPAPFPLVTVVRMAVNEMVVLIGFAPWLQGLADVPLGAGAADQPAVVAVAAYTHAMHSHFVNKRTSIACLISSFSKLCA